MSTGCHGFVAFNASSANHSLRGKAYGRFLFRPNDRAIRPRTKRETKALLFRNCARLVAIESIHRRESPNESEYTRFQRENFFHLKEFHIPPRSININ